MRELLILICSVFVSGAAAPQSIRNVDWKNFSYPLPDLYGVPAKLRWMSIGTTDLATLVKGTYVVPDSCSEDKRICSSVTFDSVVYGALTGFKSTVAAVVLTYHSGGTAHWQYVYMLSLESNQPRIFTWLETGSRASQGLRQISFIGGDLLLVVNDPDKQHGDCCSAGTITTQYRWKGTSFSELGLPVHKNDSPGFDCAKAATPVERLICSDAELSFLDSQMANSYKEAIKSASAERKILIRRQQAEWFAGYSRACNAAPSEAQRRNCIDQYLSNRLITIWK